MKLEEMLKRARDMQQQMQGAREGLKTLRATGESGGGLVKITLNGNFEALRVDIELSAMVEERTMLQDLIQAAINDATRRVTEAQQERMGEVAKQIGLPGGLPGMPGGPPM